MKYFLFSLFVLVASLGPLSLQARAEEYVLDQSQTEMVVRLYKSGLASALAHNHVIHATEFSGKAIVNEQSPQASSIQVEVKVEGLKADEPALRQKYGLEEQMSDADRAQIQQTMESEQQMDPKKYPIIQFQSTKIDMLSEGQYLVSGVLNLHGVKQPITFPAVVTREDQKWRAQGSFRFKQSDYGIKPYSAFFGAVRNQDEAVMNLDLFLVPKEGTGSQEAPPKE